MQYESSITSGLKDMAQVKVFVHATDADADADGRAMTLAPRIYLSRLAKIICHIVALKVDNSSHYAWKSAKELLRYWHYRRAPEMGYTFQASQYMNWYHFHFKSFSPKKYMNGYNLKNSI